MRLVPESNNGKVDFYRLHLSAWLEHAEAIGIPPERAELLQADLEAAEAALREQRAAQQAARAATLMASLAIEKLCRTESSVTKCIRAKGSEAGSEVFHLAMIPPPAAKKNPIGPPSQPTSFRSELQQNGWIKLTWKSRTPRGAGQTLYYISRQLNGTGPFVRVGTVGKKAFIDQTIPPGTTSATYEVLPRRTTSTGVAALHTVNLAANFTLPESLPNQQAA